MFGLVSGRGVGYHPRFPSLEPPMTVRLSMLVLVAPLASLSCSDPPPTPARGSVEIMLNAPDGSIPGIGSRTSCNAGTQGTYSYFLGRPPSGTMLTWPIKDRVQFGLTEHGRGVNVSCTVRALGSGRFAVNASVSGVDAYTGKRGAVSFTLNGTLHTSGPVTDNPGQVAFYSPDTTNLRTISDLPGCTIGKVHIVRDGALLTEFYCPAIADSSDTVKGCEATGAIAIERCRTGKEED
jgi:hypothetical protein